MARKLRLLGSPRIALLLTACVALSAPAVAQTTQSFPIHLTPSAPQQMFDILSAAGDWHFVVTVNGQTGSVGDVGLSIRDSNPGDFCFFWAKKRPTGTYFVTASAMPAATVDACGTQYPDTNGDPLVLLAFMQGGKKADVTITVMYPAP